MAHRDTSTTPKNLTVSPCQLEPRLGLDDLCAGILDARGQRLHLISWQVHPRRSLHRHLRQKRAAHGDVMPMLLVNFLKGKAAYMHTWSS